MDVESSIAQSSISIIDGVDTSRNITGAQTNIVMRGLRYKGNSKRIEYGFLRTGEFTGHIVTLYVS